MAEKKVLWLTGEKSPYTNQYEGALINAGETYEAVNTYRKHKKWIIIKIKNR